MQKTTHQSNYFLLIVFIILLGSSSASIKAQTTLNPNNTSYTVPTGVYEIIVEAWGAGGNGGSIGENVTRGGGGGGGGAYSKRTMAVYPGQSIAYQVGKQTNVLLDRDTFFLDKTIVLAKGGQNGNINTTAAGGFGGSGTDSRGDITTSGGGGIAGGNSTAGGKGGNSPTGGGSGGIGAGTSSNNQAVAGGIPGGGGGGGYRKSGFGGYDILGASGGIGQIKITPQAGSPEIDVVGIVTSIPSGSTTTTFENGTNFGSCSTDYTTGVIGNFVIKNTGTKSLYLSGATVTSPGLNANAFSIISPALNTFPMFVAPGNKITLKIKFAPTESRSFTGEVTIANSDSNEGSYTFKINGQGKRTFLDTDGDGITDNIDIDDDNDGIPDLWEQEFCLRSSTKVLSTYTFLNETFGQGPTKGQINVNIPGAQTGYVYQDGGPSGTETLEDGRYVVTHRITTKPFIPNHPQNIHGDQAWYDGEDHTGDLHGRMAVFNADVNPGVFYETAIQGVIPNVPTTYSFWALNIMRQGNFGGSRLPKIKVEFVNTANNVVVHSFSTGDITRCLDASNNCEQSQWIQFSTQVDLGNVTNFIIRFKNEAAGGGGNDLALDDIVITQKYCDTDADGIPDIYDLDSDNDGISDAEEAGFYNKTAGHSFINSGNTTTWRDLNGNGMHDDIDAMIANGTYKFENLRDSDGDGVPDFLDLDSDNDSLFDIDEAGLLNGDGDIDGNGTGDGIDSDKDGILDIFDNFTGFGTVDRVKAQDSNEDGTADYRSIASINGIMDISTTLYAGLDANYDGKIDGTDDFDKDGILDAFDSAPNAFGSPRNLERKLYLEFDGRNDYAQSKPLLGGLNKATMMGWIKIPSQLASIGTIMGQSNFSISINNGVVSAKIGTTSASSLPLEINRWYHVTASFEGDSNSAKLKLYINGTIEATANPSETNLDASSEKFTLGSAVSTTSNFYKGALDEVRIFKVALTATSIQRMVYQEIKPQGSAGIRGEVIPKNIGGSWGDLIAYYRMDTYKDNVLDDYITTGVDSGNNPSFMRIYNVKNIRLQQAPMPFQTTLSGNLAESVSQNNDVNGLDVITYPHSILKLDHTITMNENMSNLGLFVKDDVIYNVENDSKVENTWYLKLDGLINLKGQSQLIQNSNSELAVNSSGWIKRDQQGTSNKFNYNYWSAPAGPRQTSTTISPYTVAAVMKDGTTTTPQNITWTTGYDGAPTSPITLSSYWIFKFQNIDDAYANWASVGPNGTLQPGQGFTLKGSGATNFTEKQNYTFEGKPFNGDISNPIAANNINLSGNPYASALDSHVFINNNLSSTTGTLLFWEHAPSNNSHILAQYEGGYATLNLVGGTAPIAPALIQGLGNSSRVPNRYVPVGQGFFITGNDVGGQITFKNNQRAFVKETNTFMSNSMFKNTNTTSAPALLNNSEDIIENDSYTKLRLGFLTSTNFHRGLLLGFMNENADDRINHGYDAEQAEISSNDLYFIQDSVQLNIQGVGYFNPAAVYPLGIKVSNPGRVIFKLDEATFLQAGANVYLYDKKSKIYHDLLETAPEIEMEPGTYNTRFSLRFSIPNQRDSDQDDVENLEIFYTSKNTSINVKNLIKDLTVQRVHLYNMVGQQIRSFESKGLDQNNMIFDTEILASGTYIIKVEGAERTISKKMIVQ